MTDSTQRGFTSVLLEGVVGTLVVDHAALLFSQQMDAHTLMGYCLPKRFNRCINFSSSIFVQRNLNDVYIDGVSLTHGVSGSQQHIWSFASALYEQDPGY